MTDIQTEKLLHGLSKMDIDPDGNVYLPESEKFIETAKRRALLDGLESQLAKMRAGPYEYWDEAGNDILAAECKDSDGEPIAALAGIVSMPDEFRAIADLLNAAPDLIAWARRGLSLENVDNAVSLPISEITAWTMDATKNRVSEITTADGRRWRVVQRYIPLENDLEQPPRKEAHKGCLIGRSKIKTY